MAQTKNETKPHSRIFHPHLSWFETILDLLFPFLLPLNSLLKYKPCCQSADAIKNVTDLRDRMKKGEAYPCKTLIQKWAANMKSPIVEYTLLIPIQKNILTRWEIVKDNIQNLKFPKDTVEVVFRFPSSLLPERYSTEDRETTDDGCVILDDDWDPTSLPESVPILLQLHGGGFTIGSARDSSIVQDLVDLTGFYTQRTGNDAKPIVSVGIEYSLAPEAPFPVSIIETLSVVDYFLSWSPSREVHISGQSAGGNLALVAGLETHRKFPGRLKSIESKAPMVFPAADSESYYMNMALNFPSVPWLRWCWQTYLGMEDDQATEPMDPKQLQAHTNATLWDSSHWNEAPTKRLIQPLADLPTNDWQSSNIATQVLVTVNKADPLYNDGVEMAKALTDAQIPTKVFDHGGLHIIGSQSDRKGLEELYATWSPIVFKD